MYTGECNMNIVNGYDAYFNVPSCILSNLIHGKNRENPFNRFQYFYTFCCSFVYLNIKTFLLISLFLVSLEIYGKKIVDESLEFLTRFILKTSFDLCVIILTNFVKVFYFQYFR